MLNVVGATIAKVCVGNDPAGFAEAVAWTVRHAPGERVLIGLEGTRSHGIRLARALTHAGFTVVEVERPKREQRRGRGKSDPIDAHLAALAVLRMDFDRLPMPRVDGDREALRILLAGRRELSGTQTRHKNQLAALLRSGDDADRVLTEGQYTDGRLRTIIRRRGSGIETREQAVRRAEARRLAQAIRDEEQDLSANNKLLRHIIDDLAPGLLNRPGVGPLSAAQAIVSWSHAGRCRSDAAFAALAGANPVPASSGRIVRRRLNRGGDRATQPRPAHRRHDALENLPAHRRLRRPPPSRR